MSEDKLCRACGGLGTIAGCKACGKVKKLFNGEQDKTSLTENNEIRQQVQTELMELYSKEKLQVTKGMLDDNAFNVYANNTQHLVEFAKQGIIQQKFIMVMSPPNYGKTALLKTIRYYYTERGLNISPLRTFEEFMYELKQSRIGNRNLNFLLNYDAFILTVTSPNSVTLKTDIDSVLKLSEIYSKPFTIAVSKTNVNDVLTYYDKMSESTYSYKVPILIRYRGNE